MDNNYCFTCYMYFTFIRGKTKLFEILPVLIQAIIILSDKRTTLPLRLDVSLLKQFWVTLVNLGQFIKFYILCIELSDIEANKFNP